jgi:hypothetical protein
MMAEKQIGQNEAWMAVGLLILLFLAVWVVSSVFEAKVYNRLTGSKVTTWDAMWVQLRVVGPMKKELE